MRLMTGAIVYVVFLHRHQERVRHIHTFRNAHRLSPELKATQTVLLLASFVLLHKFCPYTLWCCFLQITRLVAAHMWFSDSLLSHPQPPEIFASRSPSTKILLLNAEKTSQITVAIHNSFWFFFQSIVIQWFKQGYIYWCLDYAYVQSKYW